ncbi:MAG: FGGY-family carbohydrate kinase [Candidatus Limiplasma sp.]|nr:FGGY-family carbohydrate kinase [Candidatus Limiplasma sp.]
MSYLMGIDYGTGGAKVCITDAELNIVAYAFREYKILTQKPGWSEHRTQDYWQVTCELIGECLAQSGINASLIKAVATSCALPSLVLLDRQGEPLCNAYNLMDRRAEKEVQWLKDTFGEKELFDITGNRLEDHPALVNVLWEKNNRPEVYRQIAKIHTTSSYIKFKLTGVSNINYSEGPLYGIAYNIHTNRFEEGILERIGLEASLLPTISGCEEIIGVVTKEAAAQTGLAPGTKVASGQVDACAGWLGGGAIDVGDIQMNLGTCGNFGVIHRNTAFLDTMINLAYTVDSKDTFVVIPTTTTGGQLIRYMRDNFSPLETAVEKVAGVSAYDLLNYEAEKVPPGCEGLVILPYLMGERTPLWDINARGVIFGLSLTHDKAHLVRGMMESVAYALFNSYEILESSLDKINFPIVMNEGGAKSKLWRQIITNVFNQPTVLLKNRTGAPYGDCLLAGKATGQYKDYRIAKEKAEYVELLEPDPHQHEMYMEYYQVFKSLYHTLRADFVNLARIRSKYL